MKNLAGLKSLTLKTSIALVAISAVHVPTVQAEDYKVGLLLPFSGVYAGLGSHIENGFRLALDHYAADLGEHRIDLAREDTQAKPATGLVKAKKLVLQDKVDVIAGVVSSAVLGAMRDFAHGSKTPIVVANAGNDVMTGEKCSPYIVRVSFSNSQLNRPMGTWLANNGVKTAYLMAPDYAAGHQMMDAFRATFEKNGGKILGESYPALRGTKDYGSYLSAAKASGADGVYAFFAGGAAIAFVKQYHDFGLAKDMPLYGVGFLTSAAYVDVQGEAATGIVSSLHYSPGLETSENIAFQKSYQEKYGKVASEFSVQGYDAARVIIEAIKAAGDDKQAFKSALSKVSFTGPRGPLKIDPMTNNVVQNIYVFRNDMVDGKIKQATLATIEDVRDAPNGCVLN